MARVFFESRDYYNIWKDTKTGVYWAMIENTYVSGSAAASPEKVKEVMDTKKARLLIARWLVK